MKKILADSINFRTGDAIEWQPPPHKLDVMELRDAEAHLGARLIGITKKDFVTCMMALRNMLAIPSDDQLSWDARIKLYWEELKDHPPDLLEASVHRCIREEVHFPKVATIRGKVANEFKLRRNMLARVDWLLKRERAGWKPPPAPFVPAPLHERLRGIVETYTKYGYHDRAQKNARQLSDLAEAEHFKALAEGRDCEAWATDWLKDHPTERLCPGHVAAPDFPLVCARCGTHVADLRPPDEEPVGPPVPPPPAPAKVGTFKSAGSVAPKPADEW